MVGESGDFEKKICYELTDACTGVDRTKKEKEELEVNINDKKQKLETGRSKDDPEQFNVNEEGAASKLVDQINMAIKNKKSTGGDDGDDDGDDGDDDDDNDDDDDDSDDEKDDGDDNKIDEDADMDNVDHEDVENLADNLEDTKTEL